MKILIVDDVSFSLALLRQEIKHIGHEVTAFDDPNDAITELQCNSTYDAVVCDYSMPDLNGIDFYNECLKKIGTLSTRQLPPFILYSAYSSLQIAKTALKTGFIDVLEKPYCRDKLQALLEQTLQKSSSRKQRIPKILIYANNNDLQKQLALYFPPHSCKFVTITAPYQALTFYKNNADITAIISHQTNSPINALTFFNLCMQNIPYGDNGPIKPPKFVLFLPNDCRKNIQETVEVVNTARSMGIQSIFETPIQAAIVDKMAEVLHIDPSVIYEEQTDEEHILLVDSLTFTRLTTKKALTEAGYFVKEFSNAEDALAEFKQKTNYKAIIFNALLSDMPGEVFLKRLKIISRQMPNHAEFLGTKPFIMLCKEGEEPVNFDAHLRCLRRPLNETSLITQMNKITQKVQPQLLIK